MKIILNLLTTALFLACNSPVKTPGTNAPEKKPEADTVVNHNNSLQPVFTAAQEEKIKEDSLIRVKEKFPFLQKYPFEAYKAPMYKSAVAAPDFKNNPYGNDAEYVAFITEGCKDGINFGGHYTLIEKSCGAMCQQLFIVDRNDGKIFTGTLGLKEADGYYGFKYEKDSFILITDATVLIDASTDQFYGDAIIPEIYKWNGNRFKRLK